MFPPPSLGPFYLLPGRGSQQDGAKGCSSTQGRACTALPPSRPHCPQALPRARSVGWPPKIHHLRATPGSGKDESRCAEHVRRIGPLRLFFNNAPLKTEERGLEMLKELLSQAPLQRPSSEPAGILPSAIKESLLCSILKKRLQGCPAAAPGIQLLDSPSCSLHAGRGSDAVRKASGLPPQDKPRSESQTATKRAGFKKKASRQQALEKAALDWQSCCGKEAWQGPFQLRDQLDVNAQNGEPTERVPSGASPRRPFPDGTCAEHTPAGCWGCRSELGIGLRSRSRGAEN